MSSTISNSPSPATTTTTISRLTDFVKSNRRALLISLSIAIAATAGTIYLSSSSNNSTNSSSSSCSKTSKKKKDSKKSKKNRKKNTTTPQNQKSDHQLPPSSQLSSSQKSEEDDQEDDPINFTKEVIESLPEETRCRYAFILKTNGNKAYQAKNYQRAIEYYSKAIECEQKAVYYSNRAACYTYLNDPEAVVKDCTEALRLDKHYIKALNRRASARELLGGEENLFLALCDFTACVILDEFKTDHKGETADRVMKRYAGEKAKSIIKERGPRLPSNMIIRAYLDAFRQKPKPSLPPEPNQADNTLMMAYDALANFDYNHACSLFHEAVEQVPSTTELRAHGYLMKATFLFLMSQPQAALEDFNRALEEKPDLIQAWIRKASVNMELGSLETAMNDFAEALKIDVNDPDVYYHRGQVYNVTEQHHLSIEDYRRSIDLDPSFIFSHVQLAVATYKNGDVPKAMQMFKEYMVVDGHETSSPEVHNYYGELLFAEQKFDEALKRFDSAIQLEENRTGPKNVLPWVNKALVYATAQSDVAKATESCMKALEIDSNCEVAIQHLAQFKLQSNEIKEALKWYEKGIEVAMTELGLSQFIQFHVAAMAQLVFMENYPEFAARLGLQ
ncbi:TOM (translocase of outer membrane) complex component [Puccinia graminis f. sp. tritici]|uniref:TOM (Translocase of outer membrane) complex component n=1 Tax=Puccinia graminis f. sp. tritici TaxID=56615 RepID=A0A5B0NWB2_PUCGR|nr:TOM (translocase of outer membrane) complex component [Puccinia graminis f. sp. tritici]KAA1092109.1 TOM (translocase of outer membrane) complex component [Puccinia graminis f. sp. tritici]